MEIDRTKGEVWVFAEQEDGVLSDVPRELLGKGRELADTLGVKLAAVLMGALVEPLAKELFEAGADTLCTHTAVVLANREIRLVRIMARDGLSEDAAQKRLSAQKPDTFYLDRADFTIYNDGTAEVLCAKADTLVKELI